MTEMAKPERPRFIVENVDFEWDVEQGQMLVFGGPVVCMWTATTMAGLMAGLHRMVGTQRFILAIEQAGRDSIEGGEWEVMSSRPTIEDAFAFYGRAAGVVGMGTWELVSIDRDAKEMRLRARNDWESVYQKALGVSWGSMTLAGKFGGYGTKLFGTYCRAEQVAYTTRGDAYDEFVVRPGRPIEEEVEALLGTEKATRADLTAALERLKSEVEERRRVEEDLRREVEERRRVEEELRSNVELVRRQGEAIRAMSTPILRVWEGILTMPVIGLVDSTRAAMMMEGLLAEITRTQARFTIIDLTGVEMLDSAAASHVLSLVRAGGLLGTRCLVSGISPNMAGSIVGLGLDLDKLETFGSLEAALRFALQADRRERAKR